MVSFFNLLIILVLVNFVMLVYPFIAPNKR